MFVGLVLLRVELLRKSEVPLRVLLGFLLLCGVDGDLILDLLVLFAEKFPLIASISFFEIVGGGETFKHVRVR